MPILIFPSSSNTLRVRFDGMFSFVEFKSRLGNQASNDCAGVNFCVIFMQTRNNVLIYSGV